MICEKYPQASFCCADNYFKNAFNSPVKNKDTLKLSHEYCTKKAQTACENNTRLIIVQNTHIRKCEMQYYLDLAAKYNYVVIMAITLYRFDVTLEGLLANNTDGLNITYFRRRLRQWEDIPPVLTGWFLCPKDASYLRNLILDSLKNLTEDDKFCEALNIQKNEIAHYFRARRLLCCLAGYATDSYEMKDHYLSEIVQYLYGKCFTITVIGFHITRARINAIVHVDDKMALLMFEGNHNFNRSCEFSDFFNTLSLNDNLSEYGKTINFDEECESSESTTANLHEWEEEEGFSASQCSFIHVAQRGEDVFDAGKIRKEFWRSLIDASNADGDICYDSFTELNNGVKICNVKDNEWLVKAPKKISFKTIFTGLYT
ncbi:2',3'-cyclic-nucleotide 3'-phosphodiesterase [Caerostris darwini]|uniref:2',3'-cyclic-nucleotide 3'-phosphodiesterase n=1 Tax=Caerostris darwini TaxID=1538125 RepID=A0AAV4P158_9ARAC|nr:2',3'-cyclic-nucleotide 3'-phosphodiesterase [Caerostris darwini]